MDINYSQVVDKFRKYGFEYKKSSSNSSYLTFTYKSGFFHNAEVVQVKEDADDEKDILKKVSDLEKLGVSIKRNSYENITQIGDGLFSGFFDIQNWRERILDEYEEYSESVLKSFPDSERLEYKYINAPFSVNGDDSEKDDNIVGSILKDIEGSGAKLILVEAPAGFGKTCTSYELINELVKDERKPIPFFTEFSRDRQARVFNHVFVREVDRAFNQVKSPVVIDELQNGRIVMVLDGFDELLSDDANDSNSEDYENAEPMLETIGELLERDAKVVITSRRAAVFDGSTFNEWVDSVSDKFKFKRYRIRSPKAEDWIDDGRRRLLDHAGIELNNLANPVLLSYLRALSEENFRALIVNPEYLVSHYFTTMLEREMERQSLRMNPKEQTKLLAMIAGDMAENDYTSENRDKIIELIKKNFGSVLEDIRKLYPVRDRPTLDSLASTLSAHAFFDRSNQGEGKIEFVNEFVFGNYISEYVIGHDDEWIASDERFIEPAISSYAVRSEKERILLWDKLEAMREFLPESDLFSFELKMLGGKLLGDYSFKSIHSVEVEGANIFDLSSVSDITFSNCVFINTKFNVGNINNATFVNCKFYDCISIGSANESYVFLNSYSNNEFIDNIESFSEEDDGMELESQLRIGILRKFMPVGSDGCERIHIPLSSVYKSLSNSNTKREITKEIKSLKKESILIDAADSSYVAINTARMAEIKKILGVVR